MTTSLPPSTSRLARSSTISATCRCSSVGRSADEANTSAFTVRRKSVTSSGRSSTSSTNWITSGRLAEMARHIFCSMIVLPALGGETISMRWPRPMGETMSMTRVSVSLGVVSMISRSSGSMTVRFWKRVRAAACCGERPSTVSVRMSCSRPLRRTAWPVMSEPSRRRSRSIMWRGTSGSSTWGRKFSFALRSRPLPRWSTSSTPSIATAGSCRGCGLCCCCDRCWACCCGRGCRPPCGWACPGWASAAGGADGPPAMSAPVCDPCASPGPPAAAPRRGRRRRPPLARSPRRGSALARPAEQARSAGAPCSARVRARRAAAGGSGDGCRLHPLAAAAAAVRWVRAAGTGHCPARARRAPGPGARCWGVFVLHHSSCHSTLRGSSSGRGLTS